MGRCCGDCNGARCQLCGKYLCGYGDCSVGYTSGQWENDMWICYTCSEKESKLEPVRVVLDKHMSSKEEVELVMSKIRDLVFTQ